MYSYTPQGVCPKSITFDLNGNVVSNIAFNGGCNGNLKTISLLLEGKTVDEVAALLSGMTCGKKDTSCSDQLVAGLKEAQAHQAQ